MGAGTITAPDPQAMPMEPMPSIQGTAPPAAAASPSQPLAPGQGQPPALTPAPAGGIAQGTGNTKGEIATGPEKQPEYNAKKLADAKTTLDLLNAMKPASRTDYMDWWQKTHGDIDEKYDNLKTQMGARPSDDEPQTKKEKFAALLEFGLHLMKNSAQASTNQGAVLSGTLSDETDSMNKKHAAKIAGEQSDYDTQAQAIETARDKAQAGIGTPAAAMKQQGELSKDASEELKNKAAALKDVEYASTERASAEGPATYAVGPGGVIHSIRRDADGKAHAEPVTGIDGKPFAGRVLGRSTGSGIDTSGKDPAAVRTFKYATDVLGVDPNDAAPILGMKKTGNPAADRRAVYTAYLSATLGDEEKSTRGADNYIMSTYGPGAVQRATATVVPNAAPPPRALNGLKPGMVRDFGAKGQWTLDVNGRPVKVSGGPPTIQ